MKKLLQKLALLGIFSPFIVYACGGSNGPVKKIADVVLPVVFFFLLFIALLLFFLFIFSFFQKDESRKKKTKERIKVLLFILILGFPLWFVGRVVYGLMFSFLCGSSQF